MNEELIRQCAREGAASEYEALGLIGMASNFLSGAMDDATDVRSAERALRLYHARAVAPLVEAAKGAHSQLFLGVQNCGDMKEARNALEKLWEALAPFRQEKANAAD